MDLTAQDKRDIKLAKKREEYQKNKKRYQLYYQKYYKNPINKNKYKSIDPEYKDIMKEKNKKYYLMNRDSILKQELNYRKTKKSLQMFLSILLVVINFKE